MSRTYLEVICPYCEQLNNYTVEMRWHNPTVYTCDAESGGCDRCFVLKLVFEPNVTICKIVGEDQLVASCDLCDQAHKIDEEGGSECLNRR